MDIKKYWMLPESERAKIRQKIAPAEQESEEDELYQIESDIDDLEIEISGLKERIERAEEELDELKSKRRKLTGEKTRREQHEEQERWRNRLTEWTDDKPLSA